MTARSSSRASASATSWRCSCSAAGSEGLTDVDRARVRLARALLDSGATDRSVADLDAALPLLEAAGRWPDLVLAHMGLALGRSLTGRGDAAIASAEAAVAVARRVSDERLADALGVLAVVQADAGRPDAARTTVAEARTLLRTISSVAARVAVASNLADALINAGDSAAALALLEQVLPVAEHVGGRSTVDFLAATAGWANLLEGRTRPALALFRSVARRGPWRPHQLPVCHRVRSRGGLLPRRARRRGRDRGARPRPGCGWPTPATPCRRRSVSGSTACPLAQGSARCR